MPSHLPRNAFSMPIACSTSTLRKVDVARCPASILAFDASIRCLLVSSSLQSVRLQIITLPMMAIQPKDRMQQKRRENENRKPGRIAKRDHAGAGQKLPQRIDVPKSLHQIAAWTAQHAPVNGVENGFGQPFVEQQPGPDQYLRAKRFKYRVDHQQ